MVGLKDEADFASAQRGHAVFVEFGDVFAVQKDAARSGRIQAGEQSQQGALTAAGRSHHGHRFAARDGKIDALEDFDSMAASVDGLGKSGNLDQTFIMAFR